MTMETIKNLKRVSCGGVVAHFPDPEGHNIGACLNNIRVNHDSDELIVKMMTKPASEGGKGCQFTDLMELSLHILRELNGYYPCTENEDTIYHLNRALAYQRQRTEDRISRDVEGRNEK